MFKTLSSKTRRNILKLLADREMHISGLARELGISVPVAAKHCRLLEDKGLIQRKRFGRTHVLRANIEKVRADAIYETLDVFSQSFELDMPKGANVLDVLKKVSGVEIKRVGDKEFVTSVDGEEGYYIFEVDGKLLEVPIDKFVLREDARIELKKLVPIKRKEMNVRIK